jgi:hypothetical protein
MSSLTTIAGDIAVLVRKGAAELMIVLNEPSKHWMHQFPERSRACERAGRPFGGGDRAPVSTTSPCTPELRRNVAGAAPDAFAGGIVADDAP